MEDRYINGKYWIDNKTLHEEDSDFKFINLRTLIKRNHSIYLKGIVDIGCGAGKIIYNFSKDYPKIKRVGVDLSETIIEHAKHNYINPNLRYLTEKEFIRNEDDLNLVILADVFEHVENYIGFLKEARSKYQYQLFNIPLDLSVRYLLNNQPLVTRASVGHLHYFYDKLILKILEENGFKIIDYLYANNIENELKKLKGVSKYMQLVKKYFQGLLVVIFGKSMASRLYGGYSLSVLCERNF
jgi:predicted TPR repeat methyltransferase